MKLICYAYFMRISPDSRFAQHLSHELWLKNCECTNTKRDCDLERSFKGDEKFSTPSVWSHTLTRNLYPLPIWLLSCKLYSMQHENSEVDSPSNNLTISIIIRPILTMVSLLSNPNNNYYELIMILVCDYVVVLS